MERGTGIWSPEELRVEEELEWGTEHFGLSKFCGYSKAFPNPGENH